MTPPPSIVFRTLFKKYQSEAAVFKLFLKQFLRPLRISIGNINGFPKMYYMSYFNENKCRTLFPISAFFAKSRNFGKVHIFLHLQKVELESFPNMYDMLHLKSTLWPIQGFQTLVEIGLKHIKTFFL